MATDTGDMRLALPLADGSFVVIQDALPSDEKAVKRLALRIANRLTSLRRTFTSPPVPRCLHGLNIYRTVSLADMGIQEPAQ